jgi:hypothetical protein
MIVLLDAVAAAFRRQADASLQSEAVGPIGEVMFFL